MPSRPPRAPFAAVLAVVVCGLPTLFAAAPAAAQNLPCSPCSGVRVEDSGGALLLASELAAASAATQVELSPEEAPLLVAWSVDLAPLAADPDAAARAAEAAAAAAAALRAGGASPWLTLRFSTSPPLAEGGGLGAEIAAASRIARAAGDAWYQLDWLPPAPQGAPRAAPRTGGLDAAGYAAEYAFLLKRAAVAVSGAAAQARVVSRPLPARPEILDDLYARDVAGYLDAVAVERTGEADLEVFATALRERDPGRPLVVDSLALFPDTVRFLPLAALYTVRGASAVLFDASEWPRLPAAEALRPFVVAARELGGDVSYDPYSSPDGAWSFVRGSDLGLRVIARTPLQGNGQPVDELVVTFPDGQLRQPERVDADTGQVLRLAGARRSADGLEVRVADPGPVALLRLARVGVEELGEVAGVAEEVTVESERQIPVEEILRRLQAFEDAQTRRIRHYSATNTTSLRFGVGAGATGSFEATFEGPFFYDPESGADWAWETLYVNGVRWRSKSIPEIPLIQPEKAAALPGEITFDKTYTYRLRGTETVAGRDCWVVEFEPAVEIGGGVPEASGAAGDGSVQAPVSLYRGTVWVDRQVFARVRTRAVQLGLSGEVLSNEETLVYRPVDAAGSEAAWGDEAAFVLPLRIVAQQLLSVLNGTTLVERETRFSDLTLNGDDFSERRAAVRASDVTMVRDTEQGLRYLVTGEDGERVVKEGFDTNKWFLVGGLFWDDSLDYPLPLAGINYLDLDFHDTGSQLNVFFAGALLTASLAQPRLFGSDFDFGGDVFGLAIPLADSVYRDGEEILGEEVEAQTASVSLKLGHPLGSFGKLSGQYRLRWRKYGSTDNTADGFVVPADNFEHEFELGTRFTRYGYSLSGKAQYTHRSEWKPWGFVDDNGAGNPGYDPDFQDFVTWRLGLGKNWYLPGFRKIGAELIYVDGQDLDRFSKYDFGFFGDTRVHGYRSSRVRAESAYLAHTSYGFELGELLRLDAQADFAWATDEASGLQDELLAGVGVAGTFIGPWQTVVNLDVGVPVAGPDDGVVAYVVFLKLFD